jgi:hypothetical protein
MKRPVELLVLGLIDDSHTALPELFEYAVVEECLADHLPVSGGYCEERHPWLK